MLGGGEPTKSSTKYTGPIAIDRTTTVRARFIHDDGTASPVVSQVYTKVKPIKWQGMTLTPGLGYKYYEGTWPTLPDFGKLKPAASGVAPTFTLAVRKRDDNFGLVFSGYIRIPVTLQPNEAVSEHDLCFGRKKAGSWGPHAHNRLA